MATKSSINQQENSEIDDSTPVFKKWSTWYAVVIGFLIFQIILYYLFTIGLS